MTKPLHLRQWRSYGGIVEITHTRDLSPDDRERDRITKAVRAYTYALADGSPILTTDDGEDLSRIDLIARIIDPVSFEKVRQGGQMDDAQWRCNRARDKAAHIATLFDTRAPSDATLVEALERLVVNYGEPHPLARAHLETEDLRFARAALAAAKGQQP